MRGLVRIGLVLNIAAWGVLAPRTAAAQAWNDTRTQELVQRATDLRRQQLADTGLANYRASAHGYLTFLAQVGEGFPDPPRVVKADELALDVFWRAPNFSRQWIVGRRDTLLLPTDINYHRDHLGIVQNNFPNIIRLGDGDEVEDVPHPMSTAGVVAYDYRISDSLRLQIPGRTIDVYEIKVRPKDDRMAAAVGAVYVSRDDAQIVRMAFSFTRSALKDRYLEDVSIVLENSLVEARYWLPRRQEIEIRRSGTWMEFPARGIIRGRWEICCYQVNTALPEGIDERGPEIVQAPLTRRRSHRWEGAILDSLPPDVRAVTDEDVERVQREARELVRAGALARARGTTLSARGVGEVARITRAEGLSLGATLRRRLGRGVSVDGGGRYGIGDHEWQGHASVQWEGIGGRALQLTAYRRYQDARDVRESSTLINSIAAQEFAVDYTEPYDTRGGQIAYAWGRPGGLRWRLSAAYEAHDSVGVTLRPARGTHRETISATVGHGPRFVLGVDRPPALWILGTELRARFDLRLSRLHPDSGGVQSTARAFAMAEVERPLGTQRLVLRSTAGATWGRNGIPAQELHYAGGPITAPGYSPELFAAERLLTARAEWRFPVPFPSIPLGRWGRTPARAQLGVYGNGAWAGGNVHASRNSGCDWYPSAGIAVMPFFELLRVDAARSICDGRWTLSIDIVRDFWNIL